MIFLSLIAVLAIVHWTTTASILQRDGWFILLMNKLRALPAINKITGLPMALAFAIPLVVLIFIIWAIVHFLSANFLFFIYVPVLLYSLGRGDFIGEVKNYIFYANEGDVIAARKKVDELAGRAAADIDSDNITDWKTLHTQALKIISYRGFERTFAVLFWFVIAGAVGALLYRLSVIYREHTLIASEEAQLSDKWLWLIELPAVRLMGLTWAFVGNFDSCPWRQSLLDTQSSSMTILNSSLRGALSAPTDPYMYADEPVRSATTAEDVVSNGEHSAEGVAASNIVESTIIVVETSNEVVDAEKIENMSEAEIKAEEDAQEIIEDLVGIVLNPQVEPAYSFALVKSSVPLYSRSLLFWVGAIAFATLFV